LKALKRVGVTVLVTLTEMPMETGVLDEYDIRNVFFPIDDMGAPNIEDAKKLCYRVSRLLQKDEVVAMHCKAGLGRTGTMLAAMLIWDGLPALDALENTRRIEPRWVQSDDQVEFLQEFANSVEQDRGSPNKMSACV
jgi:atypical dual specificity phosphatase